MKLSTSIFVNALVLFFVTGHVLFANSDGDSQKKIELSIDIGTTGLGPAKDIENAMIHSNFNATSPSELFDFGQGIKHPFSNTGFGSTGFPWSLRVSYFLSPSVDLGLLISDTEMGSTQGYHEDPNVSLELQYSVLTLAPIMHFYPINYLTIGMGPAYFKNFIRPVNSRNGNGSLIIDKLGILADANVKIPERTALFFQIDFQYRYIGYVKIAEQRAGTQKDSAILQAFSANYSHYYFGFGLGLRIR